MKEKSMQRALLVCAFLAFSAVLPLVAQAQTAKPQRGIITSRNKTVLVPRGEWMLGSTVSYLTAGTEDFDLPVITGINGSGYAFNVSPMIGYVVKDNVAIGLKGSYDRTLVKVASADASLGDQVDLKIDDLYYLSHAYSGVAFLRYFIPMDDRGMFALFNQFEIGGGAGQTKLANGAGDAMTGTYYNSYNITIGMKPGLLAFVTDFAAVEASIGTLGLDFSRKNSVTDQVSSGWVNTSKMSFKINLFSIELGLALYL
jgi:hypothetical protein